MATDTKNMPHAPDWFPKALTRFLDGIRENTEDIGNSSFQLCVYEWEDPIDREVVLHVARQTEEAMRFFSEKTGHCSYAWFDHQAWQLRVSTKTDANVQEKFRATVERVESIADLIAPIYEDGYEEDNCSDEDFDDEDPETWQVGVFVVA